MNLVGCFMDAFHSNSLNENLHSSAKTTTPDSKHAEDVLKQTEIIFQDVCKTTMQAYIKYKAYYAKKTIESKLKERENLYVLQPKADH